MNKLRKTYNRRRLTFLALTVIVIIGVFAASGIIAYYSYSNKHKNSANPTQQKNVAEIENYLLNLINKNDLQNSLYFDNTNKVLEINHTEFESLYISAFKVDLKSDNMFNLKDIYLDFYFAKNKLNALVSINCEATIANTNYYIKKYNVEYSWVQ